MLPDAFALIGVGRSDLDKRCLPRRSCQQPAEVCDPPGRRGRGQKAARLRRATCRATPTTRRPMKGSARSSAASSSERPTKGNRLFYLATPPAAFAPIGRHLGAIGPCARKKWRVAAHHRREAVRHRSRVGARAQPKAARHPQRGSDLPHRSLSRQGDGAEHPGASLRQRAVRADLEPRPYRPRADHRRGIADRRPPRQLLRLDRRAARHGAEPPVPAPVARRHGAAVTFRRRCRARRKGAASRLRPDS